jgi:hypothetical protein
VLSTDSKDSSGSIPSAGGTKHDQSKLPLDLIDPVAMDGLAAVLAFGAKKYAAHNWRAGISYSRLIAAALRHTQAILRGEDTDPESGLPHVDHLGCCWMFLSNMQKTRPDLDDRYFKPSTVGDTHDALTYANLNSQAAMPSPSAEIKSTSN